MMSVEKAYSKGTVVSWRKGEVSFSGEVQAVHDTDFEVKRDGVIKAFSATAENPACIISLPDGTTVLQRHNDVTRTTAS